MKLHRYEKPDGSFDYELYRKTQEKANLNKLERVFVERKDISFLSEWLKVNVNPLKFGLCHGTRRGDEQKWFREDLKIDVIGTEISRSATDFPHTIQWDFHDVKPEWIESTDFIYSNAYDHSYDPKKCFNAWASCLRVGGVMLLEHTNSHAGSVNAIDPFAASLEELSALLNDVGGKFFGVKTIIKDLPFSRPKNALKSTICYIIVEKKHPMN